MIDPHSEVLTGLYRLERSFRGLKVMMVMLVVIPMDGPKGVECMEFSLLNGFSHQCRIVVCDCNSQNIQDVLIKKNEEKRY